MRKMILDELNEASKGKAKAAIRSCDDTHKYQTVVDDVAGHLPDEVRR